MPDELIIGSYSMPIRKVVPDYKIRLSVTGTRSFWLRMKAGLWILKIGAYIASAVGRLDIEINA